MDQAFETVIRACAASRTATNEGTWIVDEMITAYCELHETGLAHSVETWMNGQLAGGLYGVSIGRCFFGESMFSIESNSSKFSLMHLVSFLSLKHYRLIDCQMTTPHLVSMGAREIDGSEFRQLLENHIQSITPDSGWNNGTER